MRFFRFLTDFRFFSFKICSAELLDFCLKIVKMTFLEKVTGVFRFLPRIQFPYQSTSLIPESIDMSVQMNMV